MSILGDLTGGKSNPWDFAPDGKVDGKDITIVALCFCSAPRCPPPYVWNANCDVNNDGKVDGADMALVASARNALRPRQPINPLFLLKRGTNVPFMRVNTTKGLHK